jgi:hypothetical protein
MFVARRPRSRGRSALVNGCAGAPRRCAAIESVPRASSGRAREACGPSHRQAMTSLRPAGPDHRPPGLRRHPLAKAMGLRSFSHVRLIGALHPSTSFLSLNRGHGVAFGRGPGHRDQGIPPHARREFPTALVEGREARPVVTVYRSGQRKQRCRPEQPPFVTMLATTNDAGLQDGTTLQPPTLKERPAIGTRPQLWISLWTDRTVEGRRPT